MKDYFLYNVGTGICDDKFRISASQLSRFFDQTNQWYREHLLGESGFTGSTASELGNCIHAAAEMYFDTGHVDYPTIYQYVDSLTDPEIDKQEIRLQVEPMVTCLLSNFDPRQATNAEMFLFEEILPGIGVGGSVDLYDEKRQIIYDYKTTGSLDRARIPTSFPRSYWFQQMTYAYILRKQGYPVEFIKLIYVTRNNTGRISEKTGKPLKSYPSECHILTEPVTQENLDLIGSVIQLVAESVDAWNKHPELRHLLAQDLRLKQKPKPHLFKD